MRLFEHKSFAQAIATTAQTLALPEVFVEKDYWITEILEVIATTLPNRCIFKGGTSLSKGWGLLDRFSEDIDLFVNPATEPALSTRGINRVLKNLRNDVATIPGIEFVPQESRTIGGFGRIDTFRYETQFRTGSLIPPTVRLEAGIQSGDHPTETVQISSLIAEAMKARQPTATATLDGLQPFPMTLLHFRRTFVEKLFAVHSKVERLKEEGRPLGRDVRHYADLYVLSKTPEVLDMLASQEYEAIRCDYDRKSLKYFPNSHRPPDRLNFSDSDALLLPVELCEQIEPDHERECRSLFVGPHPSFRAVRKRLAEIRHLL
jgi:hypothetical protein